MNINRCINTSNNKEPKWRKTRNRINQITTEPEAEILRRQQVAEQAQREIQRVTAAEARLQELVRENEAL